MKIPATNKLRHIFLADDDDDDRLLFREALKEYALDSKVTFAHNGEHLMKLLHETAEKLPDVLFLDLNMPLKNGMECLDEIRNDERLKALPVVIFSTSSHPGTINKMYESGAHLYIRKPNDYTNLKKVIHLALQKDWIQPSLPAKDDFVLNIS